MTERTLSAAEDWNCVGNAAPSSHLAATVLMRLLFEETVRSLRRARLAMRQQQWQAKTTALLQAADLIDRGLRAAIQEDARCFHARQLTSTYDRMMTQLRFADRVNDASAVEEVAELVERIGASWCNNRPLQAE